MTRNFYNVRLLIKGSRSVVIQHIEKYIGEHFIQEIPRFETSIRNILVHNAHIYLFWLTDFPGRKKINYLQVDNIRSMAQIRLLFKETEL
ncbi:MAG: hypothetical protein ABJA32_05125 [Ginsengibacter sp.]